MSQVAESRDEDVVFPGEVVRFLEANPGYTDRFLHLGLPRPQAYHRFRVLRDWRELAPFLPARAASVLDIGSGIGGIDLLAHRGLGGPRLTLVDKSARVDAGARHDVLACARAFLEANGVDAGRLTTLCAFDPAVKTSLRARSYDVILSLRGLGFIFPYEEYADVVRATLEPGGRLILDLWEDSAATDFEDPLLRARFAGAGFPKAEDVIARLERELGPVSVVRRRAFLRVCAVRA